MAPVDKLDLTPLSIPQTYVGGPIHAISFGTSIAAPTAIKRHPATLSLSHTYVGGPIHALSLDASVAAPTSATGKREAEPANRTPTAPEPPFSPVVDPLSPHLHLPLVGRQQSLIDTLAVILGVSSSTAESAVTSTATPVANTSSIVAATSVGPDTNSTIASSSSNATNASDNSAISAEAAAKQYGSLVPPCAALCMARGDITGCQSNHDYICLCKSAKYQKSVSKCWTMLCTESDYASGLHFVTGACRVYGVNISDVTGTGTDGAPISINTVLAPMVYSDAFWDIEAVMSSVCALALACAIILGIFNCRNLMKREDEINQRWTNVGTLQRDKEFKFPRNAQVGIRSADLGPGQTFSQFMRSEGTGGRPGPLDSILEADDAYTLSFPPSAASPSINRPYRGIGYSAAPRSDGPRFTNRLPPEERDAQARGEYEMSDLPSPSFSKLGSDTIPSPSGSTNSKGKGRARTPDSEGSGHDNIHPKFPSTDDYLDMPHTPTTVHLVSEYGSTTNLRKVAGDQFPSVVER